MKLSVAGILIILSFALSIIIPKTAKASILSFKKDANGVTFTLDKGLMKVKVCSDNIIEIKYTIKPRFPLTKSLVINNEWRGVTKFSVSENKDEVIITTANLKIVVNRSTN
jgi:alpha-D-xyloside xylohydrolase